MDKKTATLTLTEKLREHSNPQVVANLQYQGKLIKESSACYQLGDVVKFWPSELREDIRYEHDRILKKVDPKANYFFIENVELDRYSIGSSFAIIGEEEINQLGNTFYKNVPNDIEIAMKTLDIKNYSEIYEKYFNGELNKWLSGGYNFYLKFKKSLDNLFFIRDSYCTAENFEKYFGIGRKEINNGLKEVGFDDKAYAWSDTSISKGHIESIVRRLETIKYFDLLPGFFDLAFAIPREDQNIETNKTILRLPCDTLDYTKILTDEYFKGKNFQDYFECLDVERQKKVINALEFKKADNSVYNSFLWSKGFKNIGLDHLWLYKDDAQGFIDYFKDKKDEEKKAILKDVMGCDVTNEKVIDWLNQNYLDMIREVGLSND